MHTEIKEFSYHINWRSRGRHSGSHSSTQRGMGMEFRGHTTLLSYPDPRRIDIRQTMRDPLEQVYVRIFNQKSATPVFAIADLSGSMSFGNTQSKIALSSQIANSIAMSATNNSDPFGFIGFDDIVREDWLCTQSFRVHQALELTALLKDFEPDQVGSAGLRDVNRFLPRERALVFLISDFHMPLSELEESLSLLMQHHVVPVVLWDSAEYKQLPEFGITSVTDCETGEKRTIFLRKDMRANIIARFETRRIEIETLFMKFDMAPFFVDGDFDADALTEYFHQFVAA
ncbi:DUF58 domain-containing protein [Candidatus Methylopumilus turicensis]|uniref:DUF58 domain-containing protein n=1 Tax=Candidatus Methylopumilus turicensis TaxID=1581680 RepID=A0A0B7IYN4_9PROT|nr:DUF58 domain-containing protein [Candidatus Methylopumilus turicensis]CEN55611.1 conserved protein of unknown function [Candidatus Methylopumilus turicensis]